MSESIYELISNAVTDGCLPADFHLPKPEDPKKAMFAAGALDGIQIYHAGFPVLEDEDYERILDILKVANDGEFDTAAEDFTDFCEKFSAVTIIDDIQQVILDNREELDVNQMAEFAYTLITEASDRELIKVGLIIFELVQTSSDPELMDIIRTLALSDEFTLFAVFVMRTWPNGQMEILDLAKKVRGWGRIHCVRFIEPENDEIAHWLLMNGIDNDVMREYSALEVFNKINVEAMLDGDNLSDEDAKAILQIIDSMLVEGPVAGISAVESPRDLLAKVLKLAEKITPDEEEQRIIKDVAELKQRFDSAPAEEG